MSLGVNSQQISLEPQFIRIGTASTDGSWYTIGLGIAELWNDDFCDVGIRASAQSTAGSPENIDMLSKKEIEFSLMNNVNAALAWMGTGQFENKPFREMYAITRLFDSHSCPVVILSKHYNTGNIRDLEDLSYNVGPVGSGSAFEEPLIQDALGIKVRRNTYLNLDQTALALQVVQ